MISKILVAIDNNNYTVRAVQMAGDLAQALSARMYLLHVVKDEVLNQADESTRVTLQHMEDALARLAQPYAELVRQKALTNGAAAHAIVEHARHIGADLIVVATRGQTGSVSVAVVRTAPCPVLVVTPEMESLRA